MPRNIIDSVQGTLDFLILKTLSWNELHGYAIARWILDAAGRQELAVRTTSWARLTTAVDRIVTLTPSGA